MKKMLLFLGILISLSFTGCTQSTIDIDGVTDEIVSVASEMNITLPSQTIEQGKEIALNYTGLNIAECNVSVVSEWGEPTVIADSAVNSSELYGCSIINTLKPGKYYLTLTTAAEKSNTVEISIVTADRTPYISKVIEGNSTIKIYGNNFIKSYIPVVTLDGKKAAMSSFTDSCIEIKKTTSGKHTIKVASGEVESNSVEITTK